MYLSANTYRARAGSRTPPPGCHWTSIPLTPVPTSPAPRTDPYIAALFLITNNILRHTTHTKVLSIVLNSPHVGRIFSLLVVLTGRSIYIISSSRLRCYRCGQLERIFRLMIFLGVQTILQ